MKAKYFIRKLLVIFPLLFFLSTPTGAAEPTKVLILIAQDRPGVPSAGHETETSKIVSTDNQSDAKTAETLLAKHFLRADYQVVTSDDLSASSSLTREDILDARKGVISKARNVAAFYDANLIFIGHLSTQVRSEEVLDMEMNKAVTTIAYKIVDTASGKTLDMDSKKYRSASRSPEEAKHTSIESMATDIAQIAVQVAMQETPSYVAVTESKLPAQLKMEYKQGVSEPADTRIRKFFKKDVAADSSPVKAGPQITIVKPCIARAFKVVEKKSAITVEGLAKDASGIEFVKVNSNSADVDAKGHFFFEATLSPGDNPFIVLAMNKAGIAATKEFIIKHPEDKAPPKIVLMKPQVTRGFTVVFKEPVGKTLVEGLVKDDSDMLYVRVNGVDAVLSKDGLFSKEVALRKDDDKIIIEAADRLGNTTRKEFTIAKTYEGTRVVGPLSEEATSASGKIKPVLWGLAIGVSGYDSTAVDLKYADKDALSLAEFFKGQEGKLFSEVHFKTLVNERVTRDSIIDSISTHLGKAAPDDVVFMFLAGHGIKHKQSGSYYFIPYDADFRSVLTKGLRMSDFEEAINILSKNVNKVIIAMDTCHSGAMNAGLRSFGGGEDLAETLRTASGLFILAAAKAGEESLEDEKFKAHKKDTGHGVFTYALLEGMSGKANYDGDRYISLNEIFQYVAKQVPRLTDGRQHPYFRTEGTDMPFIVLKE